MPIRKLIASPEDWDGDTGVIQVTVKKKMLTHYPFQTPPNIRLGPLLKQNTLKDLEEAVSNVVCKALHGMHYDWPNYKRNTSESHVKLKLNICGASASAVGTE